VKKRDTHTFDAPIERVWAMVLDPDSHVAKAERAGHENVEVVGCDVDGSGIVIQLARDVTVDLPGFARKVLRPRNHVVSTDEWRDRGDGTYGGTFTTETRGAPVDLRGTTRISPDGDDRTRYELEIEVTFQVPIIGRKLERWAESDVEEQLRNEFAAGDEWLATH
jgi:hypothetical protein